MRRALGAAACSTSAVVPTATMRLPAMPTAWATRSAESTVSTRPFTRMSVARGCCAPNGSVARAAATTARCTARLSGITCRQRLLIGRSSRIDRDPQGLVQLGVAGDDRRPGDVAAFALPLLDDSDAVRRDGDRVEHTLVLEFPLDRFGEPGGHASQGTPNPLQVPAACEPR